MRNFTLACLFIAISTISLHAQVFKKAEPVICPIDPVPHKSFVPFIKKNFNDINKRSAPTAEIIVDYNGFTDEAQAAFQYAVDIWSSLLKSPVPIYVDAQFSDLGEGVLGAAGPTQYVRDFEGAINPEVYYHIGLAEKLAGHTLNADGEADIRASFSSTFDFYFGTDGNTPAGQYDFVSIVLHELGHGLGFSGLASYDTNTDEGTYSPAIYNSYVEFGDGSLFSDIPRSGTTTGEALTSDDLFFNAPLSVTALGERPKLYAPIAWNQGSSFSHLNESTFAAGNENSLMTPQIGAGEAIHDPGITLDMFADMGWVTTYLTHENTNQVTENAVDPFSVELSITSDTTITTIAPKLIYTYSDFGSAVELSMTDSGDGILFTSSIPNPGAGSVIKYYFEGVTDGLGRDYTAPGNAPENFYQINVVSIPTKTVPYLTTDGGSFDVNPTDFNAVSLNNSELLWELGTPTNTLDQTVSNSNVWKTRLDSNVGSNNRRVESAILTPYFDFSDDTKNHSLSFSYSMENAYTAEGFYESGPFGLNVHYTLDDGVTWQLLGAKDDEAGVNWYNTSDASNVFPTDFSEGWIKQTIEVVNGDTTFITEDVSYNVSSLTGNSKVGFRIVFYVSPAFREAGYDADGVLIDDFEITKSSPTAEFKTTGSDILFIGSEVQFEYLSTGATTYLWDFGDGTTSDLENPTHIYNEGGQFDVTLTITSPDGTASLTKENIINVIPQRSVPYLIADGGDLEGSVLDFNIVNVSGTPFEIGSSTIAGKEGTASGSNAIVLGINEEEYANYSEAYIYSPEFNFSILGDYTLSFKANYSFEEAWDGFIVEYSTDRGIEWNQVNPNTGDEWYDVIGEDNPDQGWPKIPLFSGTTNGEFVTKTTDVTFLTGNENVVFRVKLISDAAVVDVGMAFDDFEVVGPEAGPAVVDFSIEGNTGCSGQEVVFTNLSTGSIEALSWDFGPGATPATAEGVGPHTVTFESNAAMTNTITVTATSSVSGSVVVEQDITTAPTFTVEPFTIESLPEGQLLVASAGDSYQWYVNGEIIDGETNQELLVTDYNFNYSVIVIKDGCGVSSSEQLVISGVDDLMATQGVILYPNPSKGLINITVDREIKKYVSIRIMDQTGKDVFNSYSEGYHSNFEKQVDLRNLNKGLYFVELTVDDIRLVSKLLAK